MPTQITKMAVGRCLGCEVGIVGHVGFGMSWWKSRVGVRVLERKVLSELETSMKKRRCNLHLLDKEVEGQRVAQVKV